jgi:hypothetical protein
MFGSTDNLPQPALFRLPREQSRIIKCITLSMHVLTCLSSYLLLDLPSGLFPPGFPTKNLICNLYRTTVQITKFFAVKCSLLYTNNHASITETYAKEHVNVFTV